MRYSVLGVLVVLAVLVQSEMGAHLLFFPARPDLPLVLVLAWALLNGSRQGFIAGLGAGLLLDSAGYLPPGFNAALLCVIGYLAGIPVANMYRGNLPFFLVAALAASLGFHAAIFLLLQAFGWTLPGLGDILATALPAAVLNALLVMPAYLFCRTILHALGGWRELRV